MVRRLYSPLKFPVASRCDIFIDCLSIDDFRYLMEIGDGSIVDGHDISRPGFLRVELSEQFCKMIDILRIQMIYSPDGRRCERKYRRTF